MVVPAIDDVLRQFAAACVDVFGVASIYCILVHGSGVRGGFISGFSDIDLMVFLRPECFARGEVIKDDLAFAVQEKAGSLPWKDRGISYPQVYFRDVEHFQNWWTVPGGYQLLFGSLPARAIATNELVRVHARQVLNDLPKVADRDLTDFAESADEMLTQRLRMLGTTINPVLFALVAWDHEDALALWAETKEQAIQRLRAGYSDQAGPALAELFYGNVRRLFNGRWELRLARQTFKVGLEFLRWAENCGTRFEV
jgi:hypothetical protein